MRNWGSVCHSWFDFSVSVAHLRCCVRSAGRRGEFFLKEIPVSDRSDTFMTLKKCLCGGEVETFFCSKSSSGSIAQSIKVPSLDPRRGEVRYFRLQLQWLTYVNIRSSHTLHSRGEEKSLFFVSLSLSLCSIKSLTFSFYRLLAIFFRKLA